MSVIFVNNICMFLFKEGKLIRENYWDLCFNILFFLFFCLKIIWNKWYFNFYYVDKKKLVK